AACWARGRSGWRFRASPHRVRSAVGRSGHRSTCEPPHRLHPSGPLAGPAHGAIMELTQLKIQSYELPTVIKHGVGALAALGEEVGRLGVRRPLLVTDKGMVATGHVERAAGFLTAAGLDPAVVDQVVGNPSIHHVARGSEAYRDHRADGLVALGGGSSMDVAKAVRVGVAHGGKILH